MGRRRPRRLPTLVTLAVLIGAAGTGGTLIAAREAIDSVQRVPEVGDVLSPASAEVENFLFVGSDSRANADPDSPDFGGIGDESTVSGRRSDTIMVLRHDRRTGEASLLSIPRDLWVEIPGRGEQRINFVYNDGPEVLVETVEQALDVPLHHYIEVDFNGFKTLVDSIGGVELCFIYPTRDVHTGFDFPEPGCAVVSGVQALAYARSRYFEQLVPDDDGGAEWRVDGSADIGRARRQREFVKEALQAALDEVKSNPFVVGDVLTSGGSSIRIDEDLDIMDAILSLRDAVEDIGTYTLPVRGATINGNSVLLLTDDSHAVLSFFRGDGPAPPPDV